MWTHSQFNSCCGFVSRRADPTSWGDRMLKSRKAGKKQQLKVWPLAPNSWGLSTDFDFYQLALGESVNPCFSFLWAIVKIK